MIAWLLGNCHTQEEKEEEEEQVVVVEECLRQENVAHLSTLNDHPFFVLLNMT